MKITLKLTEVETKLILDALSHELDLEQEYFTQSEIMGVVNKILKEVSK